MGKEIACNHISKSLTKGRAVDRASWRYPSFWNIHGKQKTTVCEENARKPCVSFVAFPRWKELCRPVKAPKLAYLRCAHKRAITLSISRIPNRPGMWSAQSSSLHVQSTTRLLAKILYVTACMAKSIGRSQPATAVGTMHVTYMCSFTNAVCWVALRERDRSANKYFNENNASADPGTTRRSINSKDLCVFADAWGEHATPPLPVNACMRARNGSLLRGRRSD